MLHVSLYLKDVELVADEVHHIMALFSIDDEILDVEEGAYEGIRVVTYSSISSLLVHFDGRFPS